MLEGLGPHPGKVSGEIVGDGARLEFDFGGRRRIMTPTRDPPSDYGWGYEEIGGVGARLLVSMDAGAGYTAVFFIRDDGPNFHVVGEGLTSEQQRIAVTVFRSIRLPLPEPGDVIEEVPPPEGPSLIDDPSVK